MHVLLHRQKKNLYLNVSEKNPLANRNRAKQDIAWGGSYTGGSLASSTGAALQDPDTQFT